MRSVGVGQPVRRKRACKYRIRARNARACVPPSMRATPSCLDAMMIAVNQSRQSRCGMNRATAPQQEENAAAALFQHLAAINPCAEVWHEAQHKIEGEYEQCLVQLAVSGGGCGRGADKEC